MLLALIRSAHVVLSLIKIGSRQVSTLVQTVHIEEVHKPR